MALTRRSQQVLDAMLSSKKRDPREAMTRKGKASRWAPYKNQWEADYARELDAVGMAAGTILWWAYEPVSLALPGRRHHYRPDFLVVRRAINNAREVHEQIEFHEVKGRLRSDARNKLKTAAATHPWARFLLVSRASDATASERWLTWEVPVAPRPGSRRTL